VKCSACGGRGVDGGPDEFGNYDVCDECEGRGVSETPNEGRPLLLDAFCGAGGAAVGYHRAGFEVVGVDINPQPNYPFVFYEADALEVLDTWAIGPYGRPDAIHASPPCQHFTAYGRAVKDIKDRYEDLLAPTRELLQVVGLPYVIENVPGAPLNAPMLLCGSMFDLDVRRHRLFEANWQLEPPAWPCRHKIWAPRYKSSTGRRPNSRLSIEIGSWDEPLERQMAAMGVDWKITTRELSEAIPPAYTAWVGAQLMSEVQRRARVVA
jgi:DNA (cytosine-5)-methyltransferase 1